MFTLMGQLLPAVLLKRILRLCQGSVGMAPVASKMHDTEGGEKAHGSCVYCVYIPFSHFTGGSRYSERKPPSQSHTICHWTSWDFISSLLAFRLQLLLSTHSLNGPSHHVLIQTSQQDSINKLLSLPNKISIYISVFLILGVCLSFTGNLLPAYHLPNHIRDS